MELNSCQNLVSLPLIDKFNHWVAYTLPDTAEASAKPPEQSYCPPRFTEADIERAIEVQLVLITGLRGNAPIYVDLPALYQAETTLLKINQQLQTLELKHLTQLERLQNLISSQAKTLENMDSLDNSFIPPTPLNIPKTPPSTFHAHTAASPISIKANATIAANQTPPTLPENFNKQSFRKGVGLGAALGILFTGVSCATAFYLYHPNTTANELAYVLPKLPEFTPNIAALLEQQLQPNKTQTSSFSNEKLSLVDNYLIELESLSPIWAQQYGLNMVNYLTKQYGEHENVRGFNDKWQHNMQINALSKDKLNQWVQGMDELNSLSVRLDKLDEKPRSYITGSELKTIIFNARQHFNQGLPLEEELRRLEEQLTQGAVPESEYQRIDNHFKQLLNRYTLLRLNKTI